MYMLPDLHKRRSLLKAVNCDLSVEQWEAIKRGQNGRCAMCGKAVQLTKDCVIPVSRGGAYTASNVQGLCRSCNSRKKDRLLSEMMAATF